MLITFIQHELKAFWRSKNSGKNILVKVIMAFAILYLLLNVLAIGFFMDIFLEQLFPQEDLIVAFCGIILSYYLLELLMRYQLQELPTLRVQPYLHLPIKRRYLVSYLSVTSLRSVFNLWPWILFCPFIFKIVYPEYGPISTITFLLAIAGLTLFNNYLCLYIKRKGNLNAFIGIGFALLLALIAMADFSWHIISLRNISFFFFDHLLNQPLYSIIPVSAGIALFALNFNYLRQNLYFEELDLRKNRYKGSTEYPFLNYFGRAGDLAANEIKLILRNKRSRSSLIMNILFLFYGLIFYTNTNYGDGWKVFCGMFMTGVFIINYGQFLFSWQSAHFDGLLVSKIDFKDFLRAKFLLFSLISTLAYILILPYVYFGWEVLFVHTVMYLWNMGVNTVIVLFFANRNQKRLDLSRGASFNWEGVGATQLLLSFPLMLSPYIIYAPFALLNYPNTGLIILALIGIAFMLSRKWWINMLEEDFKEKKYAIAEGFRNK
jgi:hypothetical protein